MNKNLKIWFSPKSRKVRCCVQRPVAINLASGDRGRKLTIPPSSKPKDLSVFNFTSSSQDSDSSPHRKKVQTKSKRVHPASKQARGSKSPKTRVKREYAKLKLEAVNQRWEVGKEDGKREEDNVSTGDDNRRSGKKVSFKSMSSQLEEPQNLMSQDDETQILSFDERVLEVDETPASSENSDDDFLKSQGPPKPSYFGALKRTREDQDVDDPQTMPKRLRSSPGDGKRLSKSASQSTSPSSSENPSHDSRSSGQSEEGLNVKSFISPSCRTRSPGTPVLGMRSQGGQSKRGSPAYMKRNHMGETSLHLAATKGDVEEVHKLLALGVDPNLKDNAGWTPLHEACHLGHLGVVEVLLQQGALLNTPGYQNDSPLHDAVRSGQLAVVKLLVKHRASQSLLNMFGLRPVDYALTPEMQDVLRKGLEALDPTTTPPGPPASLSKAYGYVRETAPMVLIGSQLTPAQRKQLAKAAHLLGGKLVDSFSNTVTHVVVPDFSGLPSTLTTLQGILSGCWILRFSWVCCSLQAGSWAEENMYETGEGPPRARVNRDSLLPRLFDGCFFHMMGTFHKPPKNDLLQLIKDGGGQLLNRQPKPDSDVTQTLCAAAYHAQPGSDQALCTQYILYDPQSSYNPQKVRVGKVWSAPSTWLVDCIAAFQLLPVP